jgi:hypothetical protein
MLAKTMPMSAMSPKPYALGRIPFALRCPHDGSEVSGDHAGCVPWRRNPMEPCTPLDISFFLTAPAKGIWWIGVRFFLYIYSDIIIVEIRWMNQFLLNFLNSHVRVCLGAVWLGVSVSTIYP